MTCWDMESFKRDLRMAQVLAFGLIGIGTILTFFIPGTQVIGVKLLLGGGAVLGIVGGAVWSTNVSAAIANVESVRGILGCK